MTYSSTAVIFQREKKAKKYLIEQVGKENCYMGQNDETGLSFFLSQQKELMPKSM